MISLKQIALLSPVFISGYSAILLLSNTWRNNRSKIILGLFMLFTAISLAFVNMYQNGNFSLFAHFDFFYMAIIVLLHPLFYLYIWSITSNQKFQLKLLVHLIPFALVLISTFIAYCFLDSGEKEFYLSKYIKGITIENTAMKSLFVIYTIHKIIHAFQAVIYFTMGVLLLQKHRITIQEYFSSTENINLNWLKLFNILLFIGSANGIIANFVPLKTLDSQDIILTIVFFIFAIIYALLGLFSQKQEAIYVLKDVQNSHDISLTDESKDLKSALLSYFNNDKPYLQPELKIVDVCSELQSNRSYISKLINDEFSQNFCNFVNSYRIDEAKKIMLDRVNDNLTLENIAEQAGFNSFTSFFRAFKDMEGDTPANYRKTAIKKQAPKKKKRA